MFTGGLSELTGKEVEVVADGMIYRGRLVEVSDTDVFLQAPMGWIELQTSQVTEIRPVT